MLINNMKIFRYGDGPLLRMDFDRTFEATWMPDAAGVFPNRGPSPKRSQVSQFEREQRQKAVEAKAAAKPAAYRPLRSTGAVASMLARDSGQSENCSDVHFFFFLLFFFVVVTTIIVFFDGEICPFFKISCHPRNECQACFYSVDHYCLYYQSSTTATTPQAATSATAAAAAEIRQWCQP
jgi:hypothetical protein